MLVRVQETFGHNGEIWLNPDHIAAIVDVGRGSSRAGCSVTLVDGTELHVRDQWATDVLATLDRALAATPR